MKLTFLTHNDSRRLLLFFAGWGMDERPFRGLARADYDLAVAYDYSDETDVTVGGGFDEIMVVAWSFGVIAADRFMAAHPELPFTLRCAVNGTLYPVDDRCGIPSAIFDGTLAGLSEQSLTKFRRRMAGGAKACAPFLENAPQRTIESLAAELRTIAALEAAHTNWDVAYVAEADRIIPPENQLTAWQSEGVTVRTVAGAHLADFVSIIAREVKDKQLVASRFHRAETTYENNAHTQREVACALSDLWHEAVDRSDDLQNIRSMVEIGPGTGFFTRSYSRWLNPEGLELWDLTPVSEQLPGRHRVCDGETAIADLPAGSLDAIACASVIQWFNSPATFIRRCAKALRKGGWFVMATYGPDNFREIVDTDYPSLDEWVTRLKPYFEIVEAREQLIDCEFESPRMLLEHLRLTGVNALSRSGSATSTARGILASDCRRLTYHPLFIIGRLA